MSKFYGESETKLAAIFDACNELPGGAIVFIDEIDSLAASRGSDMHEATRRILSVLLQRLEGFDTNQRTTLICATNRRTDLDAALLNRFDLILRFDLPDESTRRDVFARYAQHLTSAELQKLAAATKGASCRDVKEICEDAERRFASLVIRGKVASTELPPVSTYVSAAEIRLL